MLERHLRIGDALTEDGLVEKTVMEGGVSMVRGDPPLKFTKVVDPVNGENPGVNVMVLYMLSENNWRKRRFSLKIKHFMKNK
jgi:hypothetical protein